MFECEYTTVDKKRLICGISGVPCAFQRYCDMKMKWLQTSGAKRCKAREEHGKRNNEADS